MAGVRTRQLVVVAACVVLFVAIEALSMSHQTRRPLDTAGAMGAAGPCGATPTPSASPSALPVSSPLSSPSPAGSAAPAAPATAGARPASRGLAPGGAATPSAGPSTAPSTAPVTSPSPCPSPLGNLNSTQVNLGSGAPAAPNVTADLMLTPPPPTLAGMQMTVALSLQAAGNPAAGEAVNLSILGDNLVLNTGADGTAHYNIRRTTPPGTYPVTATFAGDSSRRLLPARVDSRFTVLPRLGTSIALSLPSPATIEQEDPVSAVLSAGGAPLGGDTLNLSIDGVHRLDLIADASGAVSYRLSRDTVPGVHSVALTYHGDSGLGIAPAAASGTLTILPPIKTWINMSLPRPTKAGQQMTVTVNLQSESGPLGRHAVHLSIDGKPKLELITDDAGNAHMDISRSTPAGTYSISAEYHGDRPKGLLPSSSGGTMTILPLTFDIQTIPALAGVSVHLDGVSALTNGNGVATLPVAGTGDHSLSVEAPDLGPTARVQFGRWSDGETAASRPLRVLADVHMYAAFSADYLTRFTFSDGDGAPVKMDRLAGVTLQGPEGTLIVLHAPFDPQWLHVPAPSRAALDGKAAARKFSLASGSYEGISVINRGDDAYVPRVGGTWPIRLRIYSLGIRTRRPVVGGGQATQAELVMPDGHHQVVPLDTFGMATLHGLPRGDYSVSIPGTRLAAQLTLSLTRSQDVMIPLLSKAEVVLAIALLTLLASLLILWPARRWVMLVHMMQDIFI